MEFLRVDIYVNASTTVVGESRATRALSASQERKGEDREGKEAVALP